MKTSKIMLLILASFGYENLKAAEKFTQVAPDKTTKIILNTQELDLICGFCLDCTQEDMADLKEFSSKLVMEHRAKISMLQYYSGLDRTIPLDKISDVEMQFTAFRAAKKAERAVLTAKENLKRAKVALHYENLSKAMQQSLDLN